MKLSSISKNDTETSDFLVRLLLQSIFTSFTMRNPILHIVVLLRVACLLAAAGAVVEAAFAPNAGGYGYCPSRAAAPASSFVVALSMVMDESMTSRLENIRRSYAALTERLGDPDVIADSTLLRKVMSDRAESEDVVATYDEYRALQEEIQGAKDLFQEAAGSDDVDMKEMARQEIKSIEPQLEALEEKIKILLLPKDPNDNRNIVRLYIYCGAMRLQRYDHINIIFHHHLSAYET
jgi:PCRF domain